MAGALERSESTSTSILRMELMQGLVKMAWGTTTRGVAVSPSGAAGAQPGSGGFGEKRKVKVKLERQASTKSGSSRSLERSDSDSSRWSEAEVGGEGGEGAPLAATPRGKSGGARDIFNMPYTEQVGDAWVDRGGYRRSKTVTCEAP